VYLDAGAEGAAPEPIPCSMGPATCRTHDSTHNTTPNRQSVPRPALRQTGFTVSSFRVLVTCCTKLALNPAWHLFSLVPAAAG
jgi:hypothetical protein